MYEESISYNYVDKPILYRLLGYQIEYSKNVRSKKFVRVVPRFLQGSSNIILFMSEVMPWSRQIITLN